MAENYRELFDNYFEVVLADTPELRKEVFRTRYEVYCEERLVPDFDPDKYPRGLEEDEYDDHSIHSLLYHRDTGQIAGTVRLICCDPDNPNTKLPIEEFAEPYVERSALALDCSHRECIAEISRLLLTKNFRSRPGEYTKPYGYNGVARESKAPDRPDNRRRFPHAVLGLMVAVGEMSARHGITHWYAAMEPHLNLLLRAFALDLNPIGPVIEYHGPRQPYLSDAVKLLEKTYLKKREIWDLVTKYGTLWNPPSLPS